MNWHFLLLIVLAALALWWVFTYVRHNPGAFSRENLSKGFWVLGVLALILIGFIYLLIKIANT